MFRLHVHQLLLKLRDLKIHNVVRKQSENTSFKTRMCDHLRLHSVDTSFLLREAHLCATVRVKNTSKNTFSFCSSRRQYIYYILRGGSLALNNHPSEYFPTTTAFRAMNWTLRPIRSCAMFMCVCCAYFRCVADLCPRLHPASPFSAMTRKKKNL